MAMETILGKIPRDGDYSNYSLICKYYGTLTNIWNKLRPDELTKYVDQDGFNLELFRAYWIL